MRNTQLWQHTSSRKRGLTTPSDAILPQIDGNLLQGNTQVYAQLQHQHVAECAVQSFWVKAAEEWAACKTARGKRARNTYCVVEWLDALHFVRCRGIHADPIYKPVVIWGRRNRLALCCLTVSLSILHVQSDAIWQVHSLEHCQLFHQSIQKCNPPLTGHDTKLWSTCHNSWVTMG